MCFGGGGGAPGAGQQQARKIKMMQIVVVIEFAVHGQPAGFSPQAQVIQAAFGQPQPHAAIIQPAANKRIHWRTLRQLVGLLKGGVGAGPIVLGQLESHQRRIRIHQGIRIAKLETLFHARAQPLVGAWQIVSFAQHVADSDLGEASDGQLLAAGHRGIGQAFAIDTEGFVQFSLLNELHACIAGGVHGPKAIVALQCPRLGCLKCLQRGDDIALPPIRDTQNFGYRAVQNVALRQLLQGRLRHSLGAGYIAVYDCIVSANGGDITSEPNCFRFWHPGARQRLLGQLQTLFDAVSRPDPMPG